jgi:hypothetical protein
MSTLDKTEKEAHLIAYDIIKSTAQWLENPENEIFGLLEYNNDSLSLAAKACILASAILKKAALDIQVVSGVEDTNKYEYTLCDALDSLEKLANEFDSSENPELVKKAGALDEILLTITSSITEQEKFNKAFEKKIEEIKKASKGLVSKEQSVVKASIDDTEKGKELRPLQAPLNTRHCPDHPGVMLVRIKDGLFYCPLNSKQYDFYNGYTTEKGNNIPGTTVQQQNDELNDFSMPTMFFDK